VKKAVAARGYQWEEATVGSTNLAGITKSFDVSSLPAIYLIGPDSRIIARDLSGDRLVAAVERSLSKKAGE